MNTLLKTTCLLVAPFFIACNGFNTSKSKLAQQNSKPNIIIILTDDQGYADVGFNGSQDILTPNIDKLATRGVAFSSGYVTHPYCSPSRAGILTGRYQQRFGHEYNVPYNPEDAEMGAPVNEIFLSQKLKEGGYTTCAIGKWHLGDHPQFLPHNRGFDHWFGFSGGNMNYWGNPQFNGKMHVQRNNIMVEAKDISYLTDDFTNEALWYIRENKDKPFFMYLAYNAPHAPNHTTKHHLKKVEHIEYGNRSVYAAMVSAVDEGVGRIDSLLNALALRDNTLIVFLSDNGGRLDGANNGKFRGHKGMLFEGGLRVPFAISWPARLPQGIRYNKPIISLDLYSTCMAAAGLMASEGQQLDGVNLLPYLNDTTNNTPHEALYWRVASGAEYAIRKGDFKLLKSAYKKKTMLFDLSQDDMEINDVSANYPQVFEELQLLYEKWNKELEEPRWLDRHIKNIEKEEKNLMDVREHSLSEDERGM